MTRLAKMALVYSRNAGQFESNRIELKHIKSHLIRITNANVLMCELRNLHQLHLNHMEAVFAVGGDGTVGRTLGYVALNQPEERRIPVGVIPGGTGNIFAECLGLMPRDCGNLIENALEVIEQNTLESIDMGLANQAPFIIDVGIGPIASAVTGPNPSEKFHYGMFA